MYHVSETIKKGREWRKKLMNNWEVKHNGLQEELKYCGATVSMIPE
jgi:hypothetical protein